MMKSQNHFSWERPPRSPSPRSRGVRRRNEEKKRTRRERWVRAVLSSHSISMLRSSRKAEKVPSWYRRKLLCRDQCRTSPSLSQSPNTPGEAPEGNAGEGGSASEPLQSPGAPQWDLCLQTKPKNIPKPKPGKTGKGLGKNGKLILMGPRSQCPPKLGKEH